MPVAALEETVLSAENLDAFDRGAVSLPIEEPTTSGREASEGMEVKQKVCT